MTTIDFAPEAVRQRELQAAKDDVILWINGDIKTYQRYQRMDPKNFDHYATKITELLGQLDATRELPPEAFGETD